MHVWLKCFGDVGSDCVFAASCKCVCIGFHSLFKVKLLEAVPKDACGQTLRGGYL